MPAMHGETGNSDDNPSPDEAFPGPLSVEHGLAPTYEQLRAIPTRKQLYKSSLYAQIRPELLRVLDVVECRHHRQPAAPAPGRGPQDPLRIVAWNVQRGRHFAGLLSALRDEPGLQHADVVLLSEVDCGMGRSGNRHVARELAAALGMHYAFGVSYLVLGDDFQENPEGVPNTRALAGTAVLSRFPIRTAENVDLPELRDKFSGKREKRLGKKRALLVEIVPRPGHSLWLGACHLDSNASPRQRRHQLAALVARATEKAGPAAPLLLGGDFNTTTYDASGALGLTRDLLYKYFVTGFAQTLAGYMTPEQVFEKPLFSFLQDEGFFWDGLNDRSAGTYTYDVVSPFVVEKLHNKVGKRLTRWLQRRLSPWGGRVPARLDWFFGRQLRPVAAQVVPVAAREGKPVSDHEPIVCEITLPVASETP